MKVAIIDADLIGRKKHRFPNLACLKMSSYYKNLGYDTVLKTDYNGLEYYDIVKISKVFTDTPIDSEILKLPNVEYGGTGFYFDKAPNLPEEIEHSFPDYHLYDDWVNDQISKGAKRNEFKEYLDYSIGFLTRGCFRKCKFCVNQKYDHVFKHSPLEEFYDPNRKKICLLDDNFLGCPNWKEMLQELIDTGKPFKFKQGLDERLLNDEKCEMLFKSKYDGNITFAFDKITDYDLIQKQLKLIRKHTNKQIMFYVLCGFDETGNYDQTFWVEDILNTFKRIELLMSYKCLPYIMRFEKYQDSPYRGMYINLARWCNQPSLFKKKSFSEWVSLVGKGSAAERYFNIFKKEVGDLSYFYMKFEKEEEWGEDL